jgi:hypothetical protein
MTSFGRGIDRYVLAALIAIEALACYNFYCREIAWYPPGNWDQSVYLANAYHIKERILTNGFGQLASIVRSPNPTGIALPILGALSSLLFAGGRLPVLFVPFLAYVVLQVSAFVVGQTVWRSRTYGYLLLGLILCLNTPWYWAGGLFDFRFDFMAFALFGIWVLAVIQSRLFLHRGWAIACGLIGSFLVLNRFLTVVYLFGVSAGFAVFCVGVALLWRHDRDMTQRMWRRVYNLMLSVGVLAVVITPFTIWSWRAIFAYYGVGHLLGDLKNVHAHQGGLDSLSEHLLFYPNSLLRDHWGLAFVLGSAIVLIGSSIAGLTNSRQARDKSTSGHDETFFLQITFLLGAILGPIILLTMDTDKNSVTGGIIGVPTALLVATLSARAIGARAVEVRGIPKIVTACSLVVFALGVGTVLDRVSRHNPEYAERGDLMRLVELNKWMVSYANDHGWDNPRISMDTISPWFNAPAITDTGYEETGKFVDFQARFGSDVMGADRQEALAQLAESDFFVLTTPTTQQAGVDSGNVSPNTSQDSNYEWFSVLRRLKPSYNAGVQPASGGISLEGSTASLQRWPAERQHRYPFYQRLAQYRDDLKAWADKNMTLGQTVPFRNFTATVYVRSAAGSSLSDNAH